MLDILNHIRGSEAVISVFKTSGSSEPVLVSLIIEYTNISRRHIALTPVSCLGGISTQIFHATI